jgi:ammonium transporter, Amt family
MRQIVKWNIPFFVLSGFATMAVFAPASEPTSDAMSKVNVADVSWMLTASALVLLMTPGLSFFYGGMVNKKNVISTMLQSFISMGVISLLWVILGFSLAFGNSLGGVIGDPRTYLFFTNVGINPSQTIATTIPLALFALFQLKFAIITPALITGSFAERVRFSAYLVFICFFSMLIYAPIAHWTWHPEGFLFKWGVLDFAGGTVVHISAGTAALVGALVLGPRKSAAGNENHSPNSTPYVVLGTGLLWFGWFGFNAGSALSANGAAITAFLNTNTASAAAMLGWVFFDGFLGRKVSAMGACIGAVVGLVAITPAAAFVTVGQSMFIGVFTAIICNLAAHWKNRSSIDDTLDVFPCHGVGGIVGMILTGVFAKTTDASGKEILGLYYGETELFFYHLIALAIVISFSFVGSYVLFRFTDFIIPLRVDDEQERIGLDLSQHGESIAVAS